MRLKDKVCVVTGAGSGFGEGIAELFCQEGARVMLADINAENGRKVTERLKGEGHDVAFQETDVAKDASMAALVEATTGHFGRLDVMVNNAGITHRNGPMNDVSEEMFDRIYAVNVKSLYLSAKHVVPVFRKQGGGNFVNIASTAGVRPRPGLVWYNGSKGAAIMITKSMAAELAGDKIRVNAVNPVMGVTGLTDQFRGDNSVEAIVSGIPLGRLSTPLDIARATLFLASEEADFITGVCMEVDGGRCI